ncbi:hypothetical protein Tco_1116220 [Tanacetum coccineum]
MVNKILNLTTMPEEDELDKRLAGTENVLLNGKKKRLQYGVVVVLDAAMLQSGKAQTGQSVAGTLHGKSVGDLVIVKEEKRVFESQDFMKVALEVLGNRGIGSAYKATLASRVSVVVKRVRETY